MSIYALKFIKYEFGKKDPLDLGYLQVRECRGRKGFVRVSYEPLVNCIGQMELADEILNRLRHSLTALFHSLHKQGLIEDVDIPLTLTSKSYNQLHYNYENLRASNIDLQNQNHQLVSHNNDLVMELDNYKAAIEKSVYGGE